MSGGELDYGHRKLEDLAELLTEKMNRTGHSLEVGQKLMTLLSDLRVMVWRVRAADWYLSGDDSEATFLNEVQP